MAARRPMMTTTIMISTRVNASRGDDDNDDDDDNDFMDGRADKVTLPAPRGAAELKPRRVCEGEFCSKPALEIFEPRRAGRAVAWDSWGGATVLSPPDREGVEHRCHDDGQDRRRHQRADGEHGLRFRNPPTRAPGKRQRQDSA